MEHLSLPSVLAMWRAHVPDGVLHLGTRANHIYGAILVAGIASGCQATSATGNLSTGDFKVTSVRLMTDTGLGVNGPNGTGINLTSNPNAQVIDQLIKALVATRTPPRLEATELNATD